jgi:hypothetical protein
VSTATADDRDPGGTSGDATPRGRRALFSVVRGDPTDAELAALTVVLAATARPPAPAPPTRSAWSDPAARLRRPLPVGPDAWRTSLWPHRG